MQGGTSPSSRTISSTDNPPVLSLSDIMHPMSPSPAPLEEQHTTPEPVLDKSQAAGLREWSLEPSTESEYSDIQNRLHEMGLITTYGANDEQLSLGRVNIDSNLSSRERELTDMVLRLIQCPRIDPSQLEDQAFTISTLTTQRDQLIAQIEEERLRWLSERESWDRTAEALLTQKTRPLKSEDVDAQRMTYETELKAMRDKLHDRHRRISALEQEILRLRPLLLMQPYTSSNFKQTLISQDPTTTKPQDKGKRRDVDPSSTKSISFRTEPEEANSYRGSPQKADLANYPYGYQYNPDAQPSSSASHSIYSTPPNAHPFLFEGPSAPSTSSQRCRSKDHFNTHKTKKQKHQRASLMASDAYAEHVLLAAQKIGRKRAALVTGLQGIADREKESYVREQEEMQLRKEQEKHKTETLASGTLSTVYNRASTDTSPHRGISRSVNHLPKTPKRRDYTIGQNKNINSGGVNTPPSTYVFVNTSGTPLSKVYNSRMTNSPGAPVNLTPAFRSTPQSNPPTPMHSLLDAARMMDESGHRLNSKRRLLVDPESPTAKRRRASTEKQPSTQGGGLRISRVKSALDVLAESAAAVNDSSKVDGPVDVFASGNASKARAKSPQSSEASCSSRSRTIRPSSRKLFAAPKEACVSTSRTATERRVGRHTSSVVSGTQLIPRSSAPSSLHRIASTGLRPVAVWGDRPVSEDDEDDEDDYGYCDLDVAHRSKSETHGVRQCNDGAKFFRHGDANSLAYRPYSSEVQDKIKERAVESFEALNPIHDSKDTSAIVLEKLGNSKQSSSPVAETASHVPTFRTSSSSEVSEPLPASAFLKLEHHHLRSQETDDRHTSSTRSLQRRMLGTLDTDLQCDLAEESDEAIVDIAAGPDEDEDAEGEDEDEDAESEPEIKSRPSRFRSPPPPDPPYPDPGSGNGPPDDEHDADAEGEMDLDERGSTPSGQANSNLQQTETTHTGLSFWRSQFPLAAVLGAAIYFSTIRLLSKEKVIFMQLRGTIYPDIFDICVDITQPQNLPSSRTMRPTRFPVRHGTEQLFKREENPTLIPT